MYVDIIISNVFNLNKHFFFFFFFVGWGLRTDRMYITLSQDCTGNLFK